MGNGLSWRYWVAENGYRPSRLLFFVFVNCQEIGGWGK